MKFKITQVNKRIFRVNRINYTLPNGNPASLVVVTYSDTRIDLTWINGSSNESGISIERSTDGITYTEIATVGHGVSAYSDTSCNANTLYYYRVRAYRESQYSIYSNVDNGTTFETWFLEGGLSASNAKGAYFPLRSGSLANSYINYADRTKDATLGVAPNFDNNLGWVFPASLDRYLKTGIVPENDQTWTLIIRFSGAIQPSNYKTLSGLYEAANRQVQIFLHDITGSPFIYVASGGSSSRNQVYTGENVIAILGNISYLNYSQMVITPSPIPSGSGNITKDLYIGTNNYTSPTGFYMGNIQAWVLYDKILTPSEYLKILDVLKSDGISTRYLSQSFIRLQFGGFISYSLATFMDQDIPNTIDIDVDNFAPTGLHIDEWIDTIKTAGMKYASLCAKTEDGFCLWDTAFADVGHNPYSIAETTWYATTGIDIIELFIDTCVSKGIKPVLYFSIRDLTHEVRSGTDETTDAPAYIAMITTQLTELLSNYGDIYALWLDDWNWHISYNNIPFATINNLIKGLQSDCLVIINEHAHPKIHGDIEEFEIASGGHVPVGNIRLAEEIETIRLDNIWHYNALADQTASAFMSKATINSSRTTANGKKANYFLGISPGKDGHIGSAQKALLESLQT